MNDGSWERDTAKAELDQFVTEEEPISGVDELKAVKSAILWRLTPSRYDSTVVQKKVHSSTTLGMSFSFSTPDSLALIVTMPFLMSSEVSCSSVETALPGAAETTVEM